MSKFTDLVKEKNDLIAEAKELDATLSRDGDREPTQDESARFQLIRERVADIKRSLDTYDNRKFLNEFEGQKSFAPVASVPATDDPDVAEICRSYLLDTKARMLHGEISRTAWDSTGGAGSAQEMVVTTLNDKITEKLRLFNSLRQYATVLETATGAPEEFIVEDDTSNSAEFKAQNQPGSERGVPTITKVTLSEYPYDSKIVKIPMRTIRNVNINVLEHIAKLLAVSLEEFEAIKHWTGDGNNQHKGIINCAYTYGYLDDEDHLTRDEIIDLVTAVPLQIRKTKRCALFMHPTTKAYLAKRTTTEGIPLWESGYAKGEVPGAPDTYFGETIIESEHMGTLGTHNEVVLMYGAAEDYIIRDVTSARRLEQQYNIEYDQQWLRAFASGDSDFVGFNQQSLLALRSPTSS